MTLTIYQRAILCIAIMVALVLGSLGCRKDVLDVHPPASQEKEPITEETFFSYVGNTPFVQDAITHLRETSDVEEVMSRFASYDALPNWNTSIYVGTRGEEESLYVPVVQQGIDEIQWIWQINFSPQIGYWSEFLIPSTTEDEDLWMFDYFTQRTLKKKPKDGWSFQPDSSALRGEYIGDNGTVYYCVSAYVDVPGIYNDSRHTYTNLGGREFKGRRCVKIAEPPSGPRSPFLPTFPDHPRFIGSDTEDKEPKPPVRTTPDRRGPNKGFSTTPVDPPIPPCDKMTLAMNGELGDKVKDLQNYLNADVANNQSERGYARMKDSSYTYLDSSVNRDDGHHSLDFGKLKLMDMLGIIHTHGDADGVRYRYISRGMSPQDIHMFASLITVGLQRAAALPKGETYDLSQCYMGVVTRSGVYYLQGQGVVTAREAKLLLASINIESTHSPKSRRAFYDKYASDLIREEGKRDLRDYEQSYIHGHIRQNYNALMDHYALLLFTRNGNGTWHGRNIRTLSFNNVGTNYPQTIARDC